MTFITASVMASTPVRIQVERGFANVQLDLVSPKP